MGFRNEAPPSSFQTLSSIYRLMLAQEYRKAISIRGLSHPGVVNNGTPYASDIPTQWDRYSGARRKTTPILQTFFEVAKIGVQMIRVCKKTL
jgi:hypothetical protein